MTGVYAFVSLNVETPQPTARFAGVSIFMENILFIDGRNFISKIEEIIGEDTDLSIYNFSNLFSKVLSEIKIDRKIFYISRLIKHPETKEKSEELIEKQRKLKESLEKQGFEIIFAGRVRANMGRCPKGHESLIFKEKGVDVRIAVDMITMAWDKKIETAVIASSDSDLQPAIKELRRRGMKRIYLGFENNPNKGLAFTTNRTILIRNSEIAEFDKQNK